MENKFRPVLLRTSSDRDKAAYSEILNIPGVQIYDHLVPTLKELIKTRNPSIKYDDNELTELVYEHIKPLKQEDYGVWVYYPWSNRLVHTMDEDEFVEVRTSRNKNKITIDEQNILKGKKIGVIGLSVGQSVSLALSMERICGEIRLADFDSLELTNYNRIRTGIHNLGLLKVYSVAQEIAEIDPFIKVKCFPEGLSEENMNTFFAEEGLLDLVIEESDGFDIKLLSRYKARELGIPVLMEASDRCMVDVERFDLEPQRDILHGLVNHLDISTLKNLKTTEDKIPYMIDILGLDTSSTRLKASMLEIEQSINTWPQLASAVAMGGGITADVARRILLGTYTESGRYHIDIEQIICDKKNVSHEIPKVESVTDLGPEKLNLDKIKCIIGKLQHRYPNLEIVSTQIEHWVSDAIQAPSAGNNQPWKWFFDGGELFLFHDHEKSYAWSDPFNNLARIGLGAAIQNLKLSAAMNHFNVMVEYEPIATEPALMARIRFEANQMSTSALDSLLYGAIRKRCTNRKKGKDMKIDSTLFESVSKAVLEDGYFSFIENLGDIEKISHIVSGVEKLRFLHPLGHEDFFQKEIRWTMDEVKATRDGLDIETLELNNLEKTAMKVASETQVINLVREWKGGNGFKKITGDAIRKSSAIGLIRVKSDSKNPWLRGGENLQRVWLLCNESGIAIHPISAPIFFFDWIKHKNSHSPEMVETLKNLEQEFLSIFEEDQAYTNIFLFRMSISEPPTQVSLRKDISDVLIKTN